MVGSVAFMGTTASAIADRSKTAWTRAPASDWVKTAMLLGCAWAIYAGTLAYLMSDWWNDEGSSHGLLAAPLAIYMAWRMRRRIASTPVGADARGLLAVLAGCLLFLTGKLGAEYFVSRVSFLIVAAGLIWTFWGTARLRLLAFPFTLLLTCIPLPEILFKSLAAPLQLMASDVATRVVQIFGIVAFRDGNVIQLAGLSLGIEEACSGLRSLSSLAALAVLVGFLHLRRPLGRVLLFAAAIPIAILVNLVRIVGTALFSDRFPEIAHGFYHAFSGWAVFAAGFGVMWLVAMGLRAALERPLGKQ